MGRHALILFVVLLTATAATAQGIAVVVHPSRPGALRIEEIARIYLKQQLFWDGGDAILPINQEARSAIRRDFEAVVLGSRAGSLADYWNRAYFRGVLPPATLASHEAVRRFVAGEPRAIGYLPAELVDDSVHVAARLSIPRQARAGSGRSTVWAPRPLLRATVWEIPSRNSTADRDAQTTRLIASPVFETSRLSSSLTLARSSSLLDSSALVMPGRISH